MKAEFRCLECGYEYEEEPGPTSCPMCEHLYVKWVNYEEWRDNHDKETKQTKRVFRRLPRL
jgi:rubredoxin